MPAAEPSPLQRYLSVQVPVDREMAAILRDAADEAEKRILALAGKDGIGAQVRRAQLQVVQRELRKTQAELWGSVTKATKRGMERAAVAAAEGEQKINDVLFNAVGVRIPAFEEAMVEQAKHTVENLYARASNGIPLAESVYKSSQLAGGYVDRAVNRGIALGLSARELAQSVRSLIRPDVPGGVSYASMRLARTEINNAFHTAQIENRKNEPWTKGMKWNLSGSHPKPDECNEYAEETHLRNGEAGVFNADSVPAKPHPQCLCFLTTVVVDEDEFIDNFLKGDYNSYIDERIYSHLPNPVC